MAEKKDISFGSQIRSYVFCPYTMVKDHRTRFSVGNIKDVMVGDLDDLMNAYLVAKWKGLPMDGSGDDDEEVQCVIYDNYSQRVQPLPAALL